MKITDKNTGLVIEIIMDDSKQIISATFFATQKETLSSIAQQLCCFELLTHDAGERLRVERQNNTDGSITIKEHIKEALLFITQHNFINLSPQLINSLSQLCSPLPIVTPRNFGIIDSISTLFHHNKEQPLLSQPSKTNTTKKAV